MPAWTTPRNWTTGETVTASIMNTHVRDNFNAVRPTTAEVLTSETETNTNYDDMTTAGPSITLTTGTTVTITLSCSCFNGTANATTHMGVAVTGATTRAADDNYATIHESNDVNDQSSVSTTFQLTGLTAGSNTFTCKYKVSAGTGTFLRRRITIWGV